MQTDVSPYAIPYKIKKNLKVEFSYIDGKEKTKKEFIENDGLIVYYGKITGRIFSVEGHPQKVEKFISKSEHLTFRGNNQKD